MPDFKDVRGSTTLFLKDSMPFIIHEANESADTKYYGYVSHIGSWIIQRLVTSTGVHRYAVGKADFATNWTGKGDLTYGYFPDII